MNQEELEGDYIDTSLVTFYRFNQQLQEPFDTYEQYLDDHMSDDDLFFLEDKELARQLIEVGYHGKGTAQYPYMGCRRNIES